MGVFHHEEAPNPSKKCKFLAATLKDVFSNCDACCGWISSSGPDEEYPTTGVVDESEVIVSEIRSRAMEKLRHKPFIFTDSFSWVYSPKTGELFVSPKAAQQKNDANDEYDDTREEIFLRWELFILLLKCFEQGSICLGRAKLISMSKFRRV
ncbi:hypothetical protein OIU84_012935 [Salix udensis]|uniref:Uncharacterized protein n=1 Tax=Salix udensis TaxID=889485 RepID=A0AAD6JGW9_9ROSI|nr:hypothetical protein OIU84_012935 [Salix udensis]